MHVKVSFYSYFKDLTGCAEMKAVLPEPSTLANLVQELAVKFPRLEPMRKSTLMAVGLEYQGQDYLLKDGDHVSLFPPVQGG